MILFNLKGKLFLIITLFFLISCSEQKHPSGLSTKEIQNGKYNVQIDVGNGKFETISVEFSLAACNAFGEGYNFALRNDPKKKVVEYKCCFETQESLCAFEFR